MNRVSQYLYDDTSGGIICLETDDDCIRNIHGNPIVLSIGMVFGNIDDMTYQVEYAINRAIVHFGPCTKFCTVIETNHLSFRFPDSKMKEIFDLLRFKYVNNIGEIHFTNLSLKFYIGIKFALVCVPSELRSKILLHQNNKKFLEYLPKESHLKRWGGDVAYNINEYVDRRCAFENVEKSLDLLCIKDKDLEESQNLLASLAKQDTIMRKLSENNVDKFILKKMNHTETKSKTKLIILQNDIVFIYDNISVETMWKRHFHISESEARVVDDKIRIRTPVREFVFIANSIFDRNSFVQAFSHRKQSFELNVTVQGT